MLMYCFNAVAMNQAHEPRRNGRDISLSAIRSDSRPRRMLSCERSAIGTPHFLKERSSGRGRRNLNGASNGAKSCFATQHPVPTPLLGRADNAPCWTGTRIRQAHDQRLLVKFILHYSFGKCSSRHLDCENGSGLLTTMDYKYIFRLTSTLPRPGRHRAAFQAPF